MFLKGNEHVNKALRELDKYDINPPPRLVVDEGKHVKIKWQIPGRPPRTAVTSRTPSDTRTDMNFRAQIRRVLREDNVPLKTPAQRVTQAALAVPALPPEPYAERLARLEAEIEALTDIVFEINHWASPARRPQPVAAPMNGSHLPAPQPNAPAGLAPHGELGRVLAAMPCGQLIQLAEIVARVGKHSSLVSAHLNQAKGKGLVVNNPVGRGWIRLVDDAGVLTPPPITPPPPKLVPKPTPTPRAATPTLTSRLLLAMRYDEPRRLRELAPEAGASKTVVSVYLNEMKKKGLARRAEDGSGWLKTAAA